MNPFYKWTSLSGLIVIIVSIVASRIYNGVHTYNQVLSGLSWGLLTYELLCGVFYNQVSRFVDKIKHKSTSVAWLLWNPMTQLFTIANALSVAIYYNNLFNNPIPPEWPLNIQRNCHASEHSTHDVELHNYIQF